MYVMISMTLFFIPNAQFLFFKRSLKFVPHTFLQLTMNDFSVHRIIGRGGFGEVYGCRKTDTGKMLVIFCKSLIVLL